MATTSESNSAASGGILVILGIVVAAGLAIYFWGGRGVDAPSAPDVNINVPAKD